MAMTLNRTLTSKALPWYRFPRRALLLILLIAWLLAGSMYTTRAQAHSQGVSYSSWIFESTGVQSTLRFRQLDLTRLGLLPQSSTYKEDLASRITQEIAVLDSAGEPCRPRAIRTQTDAEGWVTVSSFWDCSVSRLSPGGLRFELMFDQAPNHVNMASIKTAEGTSFSVAFTDSQRMWQTGPAELADQALASGYFWLGVSHILTGWDHLLFLAVLMFGLTQTRLILWQITGFTLGHSLTLAAATAGWVIPDSAAVEWMIALSILFVVLENAWRSRNQNVILPLLAALALMASGVFAGVLAWSAAAGLVIFALCYRLLIQRDQPAKALGIWVTALFGLFHGFGFAGILADIEIPQSDLWKVLLQFNLGVEAGQLLAIGLVWPLLWALRRWKDGALDWANAAAGSLAVFWLVTRTL